MITRSARKNCIGIDPRGPGGALSFSIGRCAAGRWSCSGHRCVVILERAGSESRGARVRGLTMKLRDRGIPQGQMRRDSTAAGPAGGPAGDPRARSHGGGRESIESFVVVFLAFLVWSLEAEGFVIPTGSMAPTLMGRHKEVPCPECGYEYTVNADREAEPDRERPRHGPADRLGHVRELPVRGAVDRCAELLRGPDLRHEGGRVAPLPGGAPAASGCGGGTWRSSSCRRSPRSATSSGWWGCPTRSCASEGGTSGSGRGATDRSSGRSGRSTISRRCR